MGYNTLTREERISLADFDEMLLERPENEKWELIDGRVCRSMVGVRIEHHDIVSNIHRALDHHIEKKGLPCRVFRETFYLKNEEDELSTLPDLMVHCGAVPTGATSVSDPVVLFEVVSPPSEKRDRVDKRLAYQRIESLTAYVLVSRDRVLVDVYTHEDEGDSFVGAKALEQLEDALKLPAIDFEMTLGEIYRGVIETPPPA